MKKLLAFVMALVMLATMSLTVFAAGGFLGSPSKKFGPILIEFNNDSHDCKATIIVTPYAQRKTLDDSAREAIEAAYKEIKAATDLSTLCAALKTVADNNKIKTSDLAVTELFDISFIGCDQHTGHGEFDITIQPDSLTGFVALLHRVNGNWTVEDDATVTENGDHLRFSVDLLSPFAIVINTKAISSPTSDNTYLFIYGAIMAASAFAVVVFWKKSGRKIKE